MASSPTSSLLQLLDSSARLTGLSLCYHDYLMRSGLPLAMREHGASACQAFKAGEKRGACMSFCGVGGEVDRRVKARPGGWVHRCPHGLSQIALPVLAGSALAGVLFAVGGDGGLTAASAMQEDRRVVLEAVVGRISALLVPTVGDSGETRQERIQRFIDASLEAPVQIGDLAARLSLSPSRTGHLVRELFGTTFSQLLTGARLNCAAVWLAGSELPVGTIARRLCFYDQSHFTRAFRRHAGQSPLTYRHQARRAY